MQIPILLLVRKLASGGSERQMTELARSLDREAWNPFVGCFIDDGERVDDLKEAGIPIVRFPLRSFASVSAFSASRMMGAFLRQHNIAIVHAFDVPTDIFAVPTARFYRCPVVLSSQRASRSLSLTWERFALRTTDRIADGVVVNCESLRRQLIEDEGVSASKIHLCYNGIRSDKFYPCQQPRPAALSDASLVIGTVCVLRPEKGLCTLLEAFASVQSARAGVKLALVGSGPLLGTLQRQADELGIADAVHFEPATRNVADWLRAMDIFVLPSLSEALSNSLMEAMLSGPAAIASDTGGNPEIVINGTTGLTFAPGDALGLSAALRQLIENENLRHRLAAAGAQFVKDNFSIHKSVQRMSEIYRRLLNTKGVLPA